MSDRDAAIRQVVIRAALLAGVVLVGMQFGCERPLTLSSTAGFPHAGRWPSQRPEPATGGGSTRTELVSWGSQTKGREKATAPQNLP